MVNSTDWTLVGKAHTCLYMVPQLTVHVKKQKPSHEVEGIVRRAQRQDCAEAQIWGTYGAIWDANLITFLYLVKHVALLHKLLQENDEDVRLGRGHSPGSIPCWSTQTYTHRVELHHCRSPTHGLYSLGNW